MSESCTIRKATPADLPEIERLLSEDFERGGRERLPERQVGRHHLLVVDAPDGNGLAAAALLVIQGTRGHLAMLVLDIRYHATGLDERIQGVAEALCRAFGARRVDAPIARAA